MMASMSYVLKRKMKNETYNAMLERVKEEKESKARLNHVNLILERISYTGDN